MNLKDIKVKKRTVIKDTPESDQTVHWENIPVKKRREGIKPVDSYVDNVLLDIASEQNDDGIAVIKSCWSSIVGDRIAKVTFPVSKKGGDLTIKVRSAAWRQEIHSQSSQILTLLYEKLPDSGVENIIFR